MRKRRGCGIRPHTLPSSFAGAHINQERSQEFSALVLLSDMTELPLLLPLLLLAAPLVLSPTEAVKKLPDFVQKCSLKDPHIEQCILDRARHVMPYIIKGNPTFNVPVLDPLEISEVHIKTGNPPNTFDMKCRNIVVSGLSNTRLLKITMGEKLISVVGATPRVEITSDYEVDGRVLTLPIKGAGKANFTFNDATLFYEQELKPQEKEGRTYLKLPPGRAHFNCSQAYFKVDNIFEGNQLLSSTINTFLNENWRAVVDDMSHPFADAAGAFIRQSFSSLVDSVPYDEIFDDVVP